jgi:DNA-binding SARP family transcriptional activator/TolB-like protein
MGAFAAAAPLSRKARALLAYLALNPDTAVPRERLCGLLWSERGEEQARGSLRQCLQELRPFAAGPSPLISVSRFEVTLWGDRAVTDLDEIRAMASAGDASGLADRLTGVTNRLLANLDGLDPAFDEWLTVERAAIDNQIIAEATACATSVLTTAPRDSLRLAQAIRAREPLDEAAARLAMSAAHAAGEQGEMHHIWRRLADDLKRELSAQPSAETAARFAALQSAPAPAPTAMPEQGPRASQPIQDAAPLTRTPPQRRAPWLILGSGLGVALAALVGWLWFGQSPSAPNSIRIDRLQAPAGDTQAGVFADGLAGDLATMTQGRRSTLRIVEPGAETRPRFVANGHVRSIAGRLNAIIELHLANDGSILWSTTFDQPLANSADMRRQAALKLADVLTCAVHEGDQESGDTEVLKLFLAACDAIDSGAGNDSIRGLLRKIVARAPNFARAWAELSVADAFTTLGDSDSPSASAAGRKTTEQDSARALTLDPRQARAWAARALLADGLAQWTEREADVTRALAVNPDEPLALTVRADSLAQIGRNRDSLAVWHEAVNADPLAPYQRTAMAQAQAYVGDVAGAFATLDEAEKRWPGQENIAQTRFFLLARQGDPATALRLMDDPSARAFIPPEATEYLRLLIGARADPKQADRAAAYMLAHAGEDLSFHNAVQGLVGIGHVDQALDLVQSNIPRIAGRQDQMDGFFRPFMARFLASPRFMPLAARLGLVDIWRRTGLWPDFCTAPDAPYDCKARAAQALEEG